MAVFKISLNVDHFSSKIVCKIGGRTNMQKTTMAVFKLSLNIEHEPASHQKCIKIQKFSIWKYFSITNFCGWNLNSEL